MIYNPEKDHWLEDFKGEYVKVHTNAPVDPFYVGKLLIPIRGNTTISLRYSMNEKEVDENIIRKELYSKEEYLEKEGRFNRIPLENIVSVSFLKKGHN